VTVLRDGESVGTHSVAAIDEAALIKLMIGREVSAIYPPAEGEPRQVVFAAQHLGCHASGIRDVNLEVRAGEIIGLAGLVGAGRTELARVLFGITPADTGTIVLHGRAVRIRSPREAVEHRIAYVPEDRRHHGVILEMPIAANITMAIQSALFPRAWLSRRREQQVAQQFIRDLAVKTSGPDAPAASLSGGNQQKVALARWLATKPQLLILDEPTQGVDIGAKAEIHRIIRGLAKEGLAVLMISSDLPEVLGMSDRIAVMRGGTITASFERGADAHEVMAAALGQAKEAA
jgi:rhamnose transport system ATP-binding protein